MASAGVLDFDRLLTPIAGDNPAGSDLRQDFAHDSIYRQIRAVRADARRAERDALYEEGRVGLLRNDATDWKPILELAPLAITEKSKDLEIVALWIEALVRAHGFAGLRDGFRLARALAEGFWDHLYPSPDEDGMITRVAPLTALNGDEGEGVLIQPIRKVIIAQGRSVGPFSLLQYQTASTAGGSSDGQPDPVTKEMFETAVNETPPEWFANLLEDISECSDEFQKLCEVLDEKCGQDESGFSMAPPSSNIRDALQECRQTVKRVSSHLLGTPAEEEEAAAATETGPAAAVPGQIQTRQEALRVLQLAADFFRRTEPHSPISFALEQVVRWGNTPLPHLLSELIPDDSAREHLFKLVGIQPPENE